MVAMGGRPRLRRRCLHPQLRPEALGIVVGAELATRTPARSPASQQTRSARRALTLGRDRGTPAYPWRRRVRAAPRASSKHARSIRHWSTARNRSASICGPGP